VPAVQSLQAMKKGMVIMMNKLEQFRYDVLENLQKVFIELEIAAVLREPDEKVPTYRLNTLHTDLGSEGDEVMGEYYFLPINDENAKFHIFYCVYTLTENMPEMKQEELGRAANMLNFYLPVGSFVFNMQENIMAFKYTSLIPVNSTVEEAMNMIDGNIGLSLQMVEKYTPAFIGLMNDEITFDEFINELPQEV
jgi:hypothetical protein